MQNSRVVVLIPTLKESKAIGATIDDVMEYVPDCKVLVIDSYSDNGTADISRSKGAIVVNAPRGGKGLAMRSALPRVLSEYTSHYYVMIDGDYTYPAKHIPEIISELEKGAGVVIGHRAVREKGSMTTVNLIGNWGLSLLASVLYLTPVKDVCSGMWGFRRWVLGQMVITADRFTLEANLFGNVMNIGCKFKQIPIGYRARLQGSEAKLELSDGLSIGWFLIKQRILGLDKQ